MQVDICFVAEECRGAAARVVRTMSKDYFLRHPHFFDGEWQQDSGGVTYTTGRILVSGKVMRNRDGLPMKDAEGNPTIIDAVYRNVALCIGGIPSVISCDSVAYIRVDDRVSNYRITDDSIFVGPRKLCVSRNSRIAAAADITGAVLWHGRGLQQTQLEKGA